MCVTLFNPLQRHMLSKCYITLFFVQFFIYDYNTYLISMWDSRLPCPGKVVSDSLFISLKRPECAGFFAFYILLVALLWKLFVSMPFLFHLWLFCFIYEICLKLIFITIDDTSPVSSMITWSNFKISWVEIIEHDKQYTNLCVTCKNYEDIRLNLYKSIVYSPPANIIWRVFAAFSACRSPFRDDVCCIVWT